MRLKTPQDARDAGQALVEFALVAPLLILLIVGVFEVAMAWQAYQTVTDMARETARNAVVDESLCDFASPPAFCPPGGTRRNILDSIASSRLAQSGLDYANLVTSGSECPGAGSWAAACVTPVGTQLDALPIGQPVTVNVRYNHQFTFIGALLAWTTGQRSITLKSELVMRKE